jgi:tetratricopeptide (TPR) repeat protein
VEAEPVESLAAKGKSEPVPAFRLLGVRQGAEFIPRRLDSPLVGRENELEQLQRAFEHAVSERVAYQFTLLGPAGVGKSRLVRELTDRIDATLLSGRCLPYGEGITYWPLTEIEPLARELDFGGNRNEIALQTRRILERICRERPLVVVFDDLQWAEQTFLDLIDHVTDLARDAPMLVLCVARPELLDARPGWGGGKLNATTMLLEALTANESEQLIDNLLAAGVDSAVKVRVMAAAEGNPLFVEEMLAMVVDSVSGDLAVPPSIQALLAARLDRLAPDERAVVELAAVQGQEFRRDALTELVPETVRRSLDELLSSLVRKDLIRPATDETFRFKHLLLRDAAYDALPKEQRAAAHARFADWIEANVPEVEVLAGYHLEQAYRHRSELGPVDDAGRRLAARASRLLAAAGRRAAARSDVPATINLLDRAVRLLPDENPEAVALYPDLGAALSEGGDLAAADRLYRRAEEIADRRTALIARQRRLWTETMRGTSMAAAIRPIEETVQEAEGLGDEAILGEGLMRLAVLQSWLGASADAEQLLRRAVTHAQAVGDLRTLDDARRWLAIVLLWGPTPVDEALAEVRSLIGGEARGLGHPMLVIVEGTLLALSGDFERGRRLAAEGRRELLELGQKVPYAATGQPAAIIEFLAGNDRAAERLMREAHDILTAAGERGYLSTVSALLGLALAHQGRYDEADRFADESRDAGSDDDIITQIYWRIVKAHVAAASGDADEARRLATEMLTFTERTDDSLDGPIGIVEVVDYLEPEARRAALEHALRETERKRNVVTLERIRANLAALP